MIRDDQSGCAWFYLASKIDSETASIALLDWSVVFGVPLDLMWHGPFHFKNETLRLLAKSLRTPHHFTLPYCPWTNGAVESLGKELLCVTRAVLSELKMRHDDWPLSVPLFQSELNNVHSPQRKDIVRITGFTGSPSSNANPTFLLSADFQPVSITDVQMDSALYFSELVRFLDALHPLIHHHTHRECERIHHSRSKEQTLAKFSEGAYVLVARGTVFEGEKLCLRWRGRRRVIKPLSDYVSRFEDLRTSECDDIHGTRLKFYRDNYLDETFVISHVLSSEIGMPVARLLQLFNGDGSLFVAVQWKDLPASGDTTEPLTHVDKLTRNFLEHKSTPVAL